MFPDTIFIKFVENLPTLPNIVSDIKWPGDAFSGFTATHHEDENLTEISFYVDENGKVDSSLVVIVLKGDELFGKFD